MEILALFDEAHPVDYKADCKLCMFRDALEAFIDAERAVTAALREFAIERAQALEGWVGSSEDYQAIPDEVAAIEAAARPSTTL
jgi:hypothetical protein